MKVDLFTKETYLKLLKKHMKLTIFCVFFNLTKVRINQTKRNSS